MAKSSAAPAQKDFRNLRRELIDEIAAMSDDPTMHWETFHEEAGQLIADHAKTYARAAHQALYEALSAAVSEIQAFYDAAAEGRIKTVVSVGQFARLEKMRAALADAAQEGEANGG